jgi:nucleoside-diphosphate-sugar epimerase
MARVLITGGCGNLGRLCATDLSAAGHDVVLLDYVPPELAPTPWSTDLPVHVADLTDGPAVEALLLAIAPEVVVHLAAERTPSDHPDPRWACAPRFAAPPTDPDASSDGRHAAGAPTRPRDATFRSNVLGTYYLLDSAVRAGARRIVAASSLCVLGAAFRISTQPFVPEYLPVDERHPLRPEDSYSLSKLANEEMYTAYTRAYGIEAVAIRPPVVLYEDVEWTWAGRFHDVAPPPSALPTRGIEANLWMYVDGRDLARAFRLAVEAPGLTEFEAFYVATGRMIATSPKRWLQEHLPHLDPLTAALGEDDDLLSWAKASRLLGYEPAHVWPRERYAADIERRQAQARAQARAVSGSAAGRGTGTGTGTGTGSGSGSSSSGSPS